MATTTMSIPDFVRHGWQQERKIDVFLAHLERHKIKYRIIGTAIILFLGVSGIAFADTGIDKGAKKLYTQLIGVGKWVIIIKGGIDTIKAVTEGDFQSTKTKFLGYVLTYCILWALPWAFDEVEKLFKEMEGA